MPASELNLFADGMFKFGVPGETGVVEDKDWIDVDFADWLTHYSTSANITETVVLIDASAGASFTIFEDCLLKTFVTYSYMYFSWTAYGGSFLYPITYGGHFYFPIPGEMGAYEQTWNILSPGISFYGAFNRYFDIEISLKLSPLLWCSAKDEHPARDLVITEEFFGGFFIEPGLCFSFKLDDFFTLSFSFLYRNISGARGDSNYKEEGQPAMMVENLGGAGYSAFDAGIIAKFNITR
jgi:outer membrane protease